MPKSPQAKRVQRKTEATKNQRQPDDFVSVARRLGCDDSEERFDEALKTIAKQKPKEPSKPKAKAER
jgi:hypothetical protein